MTLGEVSLAIVVVAVLVAAVVFFPGDRPTLRLVKIIRAWRRR